MLLRSSFGFRTVLVKGRGMRKIRIEITLYLSTAILAI